MIHLALGSSGGGGLLRPNWILLMEQSQETIYCKEFHHVQRWYPVFRIYTAYILAPYLRISTSYVPHLHHPPPKKKKKHIMTTDTCATCSMSQITPAKIQNLENVVNWKMIFLFNWVNFRWHINWLVAPHIFFMFTQFYSLTSSIFFLNGFFPTTNQQGYRVNTPTISLIWKVG